MRKTVLILLFSFLAGAALNDARDANEAYRNGHYEKAEELYRKAINATPENEKLYFNLANTLAQQGKREEALRVFERFRSMTDDVEKQAMADYNIGNIFVEMGKWDKAVKRYQEALRHKAADEDAKHNYELAIKKQKDQQKQQQQQNQQGDQQQDNQQQDRDNQNRQDQQNQQNQQQNQNRQQQQVQNKISKAEAEKILKALEQEEKDLLKEFKKKKLKSSNSTNEKDW